MAVTTASSSSKVYFDQFRDHLDDFNDRRERLIKASRDVTNVSKKTIFLLHRIVLEDPRVSVEDVDLRKRAAKAAYDKLGDVKAIFAIMQRDLLDPTTFWRHQRQVSPGLQEYIEALSFAHYLDHNTLITFDQVQQTLVDTQGQPYFLLTISDYLLGVSDLTGELMRFAISTISRRGGRSNARRVCGFVRNCKADLERLTPYIRDLKKKQLVTAQSLEKIEDAAYTIMVRSSEYDLPPELLDDIVANSISDYYHRSPSSHYSGGGSGRRHGGNDSDEDDGVA